LPEEGCVSVLLLLWPAGVPLFMLRGDPRWRLGIPPVPAGGHMLLTGSIGWLDKYGLYHLNIGRI